ncbi:hypothetical protein QE424_002456 [Stenotrophomonas rhizophila]|uniref:Uncharacterized protein n=1 Tax=Stenotrophomonas rhizophila TaxID=216778 RepID=A0AAP5AJU2_9GAMM|nr:hypothetical protein [Stenotrophomonas rhizophila]
MYAENHFTPLSRHAKRDRLLAHLSARFDKPRFRVHAWSGMAEGEPVCLAGWSTRAGDCLALSEDLLALRLWDGGEMLAEAQVSLLRLPADKFPRAVWALIEAHGIVLELDVPGNGPMTMTGVLASPGHGPSEQPQAGSGDRRPGAASRPHVHSTNPDSVRRLVQLQASKRADRLEDAEHRYREAMARKSRYLERVKRGLEDPHEGQRLPGVER